MSLSTQLSVCRLLQQVDMIRYDIWYHTFVNCSWVDIRWQ